ncbi:MAG: cysteine desulfurase family protein [Bacteroidota bacterium]
MTRLPVYLDHNATTPCEPAVVEAMLPFFTDTFGNAASNSHVHGWLAAEAVDAARQQVASLVGSSPKDIVFTSGATEALNLGIRGIVEHSDLPQKHIITWATEHKAVLDVCAYLGTTGVEVTVLPVKHNGLPNLELFRSAIRKNTILAVMMAANNETGVIMPVNEIASIAHEHGVKVCCDATQTVGKIRTSVGQLGVDLMAFSAHKFYGPKGTGALYIRSGLSTTVKPLIFGGGHERGLRSGTLNVPGIVGMGKACEIAAGRMEKDAARAAALRDKLISGLMQLPGVSLNGKRDVLLPHVANVTFDFPGGDRLLQKIAHSVAASSGSACSSAITSASHVLTAMGLSEQAALSSIRFSLGRNTTEEEIDLTIATIHHASGKIQS